ncbi:anaphase-promoting complex subunit 6-like [Pararge aegeria]|uniref:Jg16658 protein n=1 Tax=Pararge aegeria aegeria TaxID=348720 RepID=A0A8S4RCB4_9NEOP|nr:anaphase-promoting complex subunit 6-like [Pararge aegeria]CAH2234209.1 jg16658 [Pararge aegeria aegeria]
MKFLLALAFLTVVCAIPRPERLPARIEEVEQLQPSQGSGDSDSQVSNGIRESPLEQLGNSDESDEAEENDDDEDDSDEKLAMTIVNALSSIREALRKKIQEKLDQNKTTRVPANEDSLDNTAVAPQHNDTESEGPSSDHIGLPQNNIAVTAGNDTASDHNPRINVTLIKKEFHDKIENLISNILRPWLGNNSVEDDGGNATAVEPPQRPNKTIDNGSGSLDGRVENDTATVAPSKGNDTVPRQNDVVSNDTEIEASNGKTPVNGSSASGNELSTIAPAISRSEPIISSEVPQVSSKLASQSQVRFVNTYSRE